jgi:hypothetical protein
MANHGYQPLKPQMDEGGLTLSILSTFDKRCPGDAELEHPTMVFALLHARFDPGSRFLGLARAVAPAFRLARFPMQGRKGHASGYGVTAR